MSGLKASAGLALSLSDRAEHDAAPGARNVLIPQQSLPVSSRIAARHMRKPISPEMFLEKPVFNPHCFDPVPLPFGSPMTVDDFVAWRDDGNGGGRGMAASASSGAVPGLDMPLARSKKDKKDKKEKGLNTGRKTKRKKDSSATPHGEAPPPPPLGDTPPAFPPPPPGPAPPPPI